MKSGWPGQHKPIVTNKLWDRVQNVIDKQELQTRHRWDHSHLLKGKLRTHEDSTMSPGAVHRPGKTKGQKRLVRYYISQKAMRKGYKHCPIKTINATHIDTLVRSVVLDHLSGESLEHLRHRDQEVRDFWVREIIERVVLAPDQVMIELSKDRIEACKGIDWTDLTEDKVAVDTCIYTPSVDHRRGNTVLKLAIQIKRLDGKRMLLAPDGQDLVIPADPKPKDHIVTSIGNAYSWREQMMNENLTLSQLASRQGISESMIRKYLPLINLSPRILNQALVGLLPPRVTLLNLLDAARDLDWSNQAIRLGLDRLEATKSS
jgi:hypothetical protein